MDRKKSPALVALAVAALALASTPLPEAPPELAGQMCLPDGSDRLFFAMSIEDESGEVLAEPMLVGMCGVPLLMTLAEPGAAHERMSLSLDPQGTRDGAYDIAFELSVPGRVEAGKGRVRLKAGEEKRARVQYPGGHLTVQLAAFAVPSTELELYLEQGAKLKGLPIPGRT